MTQTLQRPIPVYNVDGSPNKAGSITEVVDLVLRYKDHSECAVFAVTNLGKQDMILGLTWLREHNPEVDWETGEIKMSCCPQKCRTCSKEEKEEKKLGKKKEEKLQVCWSGSMPELIEESEEEEEEEGDVESEWMRMLGVEEEESEWEIEEGDHIFYTALHSEAEGCGKAQQRDSPQHAEEHIQVYSTIST